jgi:hypothetical protein
LFQPYASVPWPVIDDCGKLVPGYVACGRETLKGTPCTHHRAKFSPACSRHQTPKEEEAANFADQTYSYYLNEKFFLSGRDGSAMRDPEIRDELRNKIRAEAVISARIFRDVTDDHSPEPAWIGEFLSSPGARQLLDDLIAERRRLGMKMLREIYRKSDTR